MIALTFAVPDTVNKLIFAAINFCVFVFEGIFTAIYFRELQTGLFKNNIQHGYMDTFAAIYFRKFSFLGKVLKINCWLK